MALLLGVEQQTYSSWENERREPRSSNAYDALCVVCSKIMEYYINSIGRLESRLDFLVDFLVSTRKKYNSRASKESNPIAFGVFSYFSDAYLKRTHHKLTTSVGQGIKNTLSLLQAHSPETIKKVVDAFFVYDKRTRYSWGAFLSSFDNILPNISGVRRQGMPEGRCPYCNRLFSVGHAEDCPTRNKENA